ncbi:hypothetical protein Tco_0618041 [Tanacetum coccineum]
MFKNYLDSVRGELKEELKEEMKVNLKEEMCEELKEEMREELKEEMRAEIQDMLVDYVRASRIVEDQMKNTLNTEHSPRREAPRLHKYEDPSESPGLRGRRLLPDVFLSQNISKKEGITKIVDVQDDYNQVSLEYGSCKSLLMWEP